MKLPVVLVVAAASETLVLSRAGLETIGVGETGAGALGSLCVVTVGGVDVPATGRIVIFWKGAFATKAGASVAEVLVGFALRTFGGALVAEKSILPSGAC